MASMGTIVLYPCSGMGHLISMVELGKFILRHHPSSAVTILTAPPSSETASAFTRHVSAAVPSITFHPLPEIPINADSFPSREAVALELFRRRNPDVRRALETITRSAAVSAFVIDFFGTSSIPIAAEFHIPSYYFITSGAAFVALLLYFPTLHKITTKSFKDMNDFLHVPGVPPFPSSDVLRTMLDRTTKDYEDFLNISINLRSSAGILVNTFESLETRTLESIREGKCNPDGSTPPVFSVGPLLATTDKNGGAQDCGAIQWLDEQPRKSVVYLCFGSLGVFSAAQLKETAEGLERSGHRFLWVVRPPPGEPDLDADLPTGFVDRTKDRGLVVSPWAPQVAVLNHESVGGFVTHCGWNSILEAVWAGVPMVAWPLYAEQHLNRAVLVEEMKVALRMEAEEEGFVAAEEVEERVRELMDGESENGKGIRKVVEERSLEARAALAEGGASVATLGKLVELWKSG
ncbi:hypothetical protein ACS0TY_004602 [Phlomoides rotata]